MRRIRTVIVSAAAATFLTLPIPGHAAPIDAVKTRVDQIKRETAAIKSQTTNIQAKVSDLASQVNAQLAEMNELKATLDTLKQMKDRFSGGGFDPAAILEVIDLEEMKAKLDEMKQNRQELQALLKDPDIETFRQEFLATLAGINQIVAEGGVVEATPFQTLIEKAPRPIIAVLKASTETVLAPLKEAVSSTTESVAELKELGLLELTGLNLADTHAGHGEGRMMQAGLKERLKQNVDVICNLSLKGGTKAALHLLWRHERWLIELESHWKKMSARAELMADQKFVPPSWGVHGYLSIGVPKIPVKKNMDDVLIRIERNKKLTGSTMKLVEWIKDDSEACEHLKQTATRSAEPSPPVNRNALRAGAPEFGRRYLFVNR